MALLVRHEKSAQTKIKYSQHFSFTQIHIPSHKFSILGTMEHKSSFCFPELRSTGGRVLLDDDGLTARAHVAVDLITDLDPELSLISEI